MTNRQHRKLTSLLTALLLITSLSVFAESTKLTALKDTYEKSLTKINIAHIKSTSDSQKKHLVTMKQLSLKMQKKGELDSILEINKEIERFTAKRTITLEDFSELPELNLLQKDYIQAIGKQPLAKAKQIASLADKYDAALATHQKSLTQSGDIEAAILVKKERDVVNQRPEITSARFALAELEANKPVVEEKTPDPEPEPEPVAVTPPKVVKKWTGSTDNYIKRRFDKFGKCVADQDWEEAKQYIDPKTLEKTTINHLKGKLRMEFQVFSMEKDRRLKVSVEKVTLNDAEDSATLIPKMRVNNRWKSLRAQTWILADGDWYIKVDGRSNGNDGDDKPRSRRDKNQKSRLHKWK